MKIKKDYGDLSFWDLEGFNLAILGKQGWKVLTNSSPNSL